MRSKDRSITFVLGLMLMVLCFHEAGAQETTETYRPQKGWNMIVGFDKSVMRGGNKSTQNVIGVAELPYCEFYAGAGYRLYLWEGLNFNPQALFSYRHNIGENSKLEPTSMYKWQTHLELQANMSYVYKCVELFTGPSLKTRLFAGKEDLSGASYDPFEPYRVRLMWLFGAGLNYKRFGVRLNFKMPVTKVFKSSDEAYEPLYGRSSADDNPYIMVRKYVAYYELGVSLSYNF